MDRSRAARLRKDWVSGVQLCVPATEFLHQGPASLELRSGKLIKDVYGYLSESTTRVSEVLQLCAALQESIAMGGASVKHTKVNQLTTRKAE